MIGSASGVLLPCLPPAVPEPIVAHREPTNPSFTRRTFLTDYASASLRLDEALARHGYDIACLHWRRVVVVVASHPTRNAAPYLFFAGGAITHPNTANHFALIAPPANVLATRKKMSWSAICARSASLPSVLTVLAKTLQQSRTASILLQPRLVLPQSITMSSVPGGKMKVIPFCPPSAPSGQFELIA